MCKTMEIRLDECEALPYLLKSIFKLLPLDEYVESSVKKIFRDRRKLIES